MYCHYGRLRRIQAAAGMLNGGEENCGNSTCAMDAHAAPIPPPLLPPYDECAQASTEEDTAPSALA